MKGLVLGYGLVGRAISLDLLQADDVDAVMVVDVRQRS